MSLNSLYVQSLVLAISDYIPDAGLVTGILLVPEQRRIRPFGWHDSLVARHKFYWYLCFMVASNTGDCCQLWTTGGVYLGKKRTLTATLRSGYQEEDFAVSFRHLPN
jgi:hypothetical protein